ncbi:HAMP domain-containing protein [Thalassospiraceae bacterium LMO-SO8]|nr:HAMP domain-containing protein [Alphaproteobacteria bacterium LMO-S08]WND74414.1 HAMP domain-containing protein [Thalassospiraceae bacterium LMO-SO8]
MADRDYDHTYLALRRPTYASRTFLGGTRLSTRTGMFVIVGLLAVMVYAGLIVHVNDRVSAAHLGLERAQNLSTLVTAVARGQAALQTDEKRYILTRDAAAAQDMRGLLDEQSRTLDALGAHADAGDLARPIATLKDGLVQYDQHLSELVGALSSNPAAAGGALRDADQALAPRLAASGRRGLPELLSRVNQLGSEMVLTGDPVHLVDLQDAYKQLAARIEDAGLPRGDRAAITDLLIRHQDAMMALITARVRVNEDAQRFDDILTYMAPSLAALTSVAGELTGERWDALTAARKFAAASLVGGGAAIILWVVTLGLIVMRTITRPVQALAEAADRLARGDRTVMIPGRGNRDAVGQLARAFDDWMAAMADAEHLRQDLDHAQAKTLQAVETMEAEARRAQAASDDAEVLRRTLADYRREMDEMENLLAEFEEDQANQVPVPALARAQALAQSQVQAAAAGGEAALGKVSNHLSQVSRQASAAIIDVELTDTLIRNIAAAREQLDGLGGHVVAVREEFNQFLFGRPNTPGGADPAADGDKTVAMGGGAVRQASLKDPESRARLAAIRDAVDRAERALSACTREVEHVTDTAQRLAASASDEARLATDQLAAQSDYLRALLDTLAHRTQPQAIAGPVAQASGSKDRDAG